MGARVLRSNDEGRRAETNRRPSRMGEALRIGVSPATESELDWAKLDLRPWIPLGYDHPMMSEPELDRSQEAGTRA